MLLKYTQTMNKLPNKIKNRKFFLKRPQINLVLKDKLIEFEKL